MIPNTELLPDAEIIPVSGHVEECPRCGDTNLGEMITLSLQHCTCCDAWLRYARGTQKYNRRATDKCVEEDHF